MIGRPFKLLFTILCLMLFGTSFFVYAQDTSFLQIEYYYEDTPLQDVSYEVYQVAEREIDQSLCLQDGFCDCVIVWEGLDSSAKWVETANNIENYIAVHYLSSDYSGKTDDDGKIELYNLEAGLYFINIEDTTLGGNILEAQSILVTVQEGISQLEYSPKIRSISSSGGGGGDDDDEPASFYLQVDKVWKNESLQEVRPEFVTIQIYRDGTVYNEVQLNAQNGWSYGWSGIDRGYTWGVLELDSPDCYEVSYQKSGNTFEVINTYSPGGGQPGGDQPDGETPDGEAGRDPSLTGHLRNWEKLPQTGTIAWMIPIFSGMGMLLIAIGILWTYKEKRR